MYHRYQSSQVDSRCFLCRARTTTFALGVAGGAVLGLAITLMVQIFRCLGAGDATSTMVQCSPIAAFFGFVILLVVMLVVAVCLCVSAYEHLVGLRVVTVPVRGTSETVS